MPRQSLIYGPKTQIEQIKTDPPSESFVKKSSSINDLTSLASRLHQKTVSQSDSLKISSSLSYAAYVYEQFRNIIDNKSDHLLRRNAIERILKRLLWENSQTSANQLAQQLIKELVWSRYIANNVTSFEDLNAVATMINKYLPKASKNPIIFSLASAEIEELIDPSLALTEMLCQTMQNWFTSHFNWTDSQISENDKELILFVAIRKVLIKSDNARIAYQLIKSRNPTFSKETQEDFIEKFPEIIKTLTAVKSIQSSLVFNKLYRQLTKYTAQFLILKDLIEANPNSASEIVSSKEKLDREIDRLCRIRYDRIQQKITTSIIRSVVYIFATKMLFVLLIEVPYELLTAGHLNIPTLGINLALPPLLMILVGLGIQKPDKKNTQLITNRVEELVNPSQVTPQQFSLIYSHRDNRGSSIFNIIYSIFALFIFFIIVSILVLLHFNFVGIVVFFLFLSLVLLFGFRVSFAATELYVDSPQKSPFIRLFEQLSLPFLNLGVFLSKGLDQLNFLTTIMDIIFEMPLKTFLDIINRWSDFVSNKRAEIVEVPIQ